MRLFDRSERSVSLTDAGAGLLTEARRVLFDAEGAWLAARHANGCAHGRLRIGYTHSSTAACLIDQTRHADAIGGTVPSDGMTAVATGELARSGDDCLQHP